MSHVLGIQTTGDDVDLTPYKPNEAEQKLIDALRSGKYAQTSGVLRDSRGYCCLGVVCDVYNPNRWNLPLDGQMKYGYRSGEDETAYNDYYDLPDIVRQSLEWSHESGRLLFTDKSGVRETLAQYNDYHTGSPAGFNFNMIADIIQAGLVEHIEDVLHDEDSKEMEIE